MRARLPHLKRLAPALLLASFAGIALANPGETAVGCSDLGAEGRVAHAAEWICSVTEVVNRLGLFNWMDGIAWAVLITFFVARILSISVDPNAGPKLRSHIIASFFAFGLMLSLTPIRSGMFDVWRYSYTFSQTHGADAVWHTLAVLAEDLGAEGVGATLTGLAIADQLGDPVFDIVAEGQAGGGAAVIGVSAQAAQRIGKLGTIARAVGGAKNLLKGLPIFRIVDAILLPVMSLYSMMVFGSALTIIIGAFLLPVGAVMIVAGAGSSFFSNWGNVMIASVITMVVFPLMWGVTTQVAFVTPLTNFLGDFADMQAEYRRAIEEITSRPSSINPLQTFSNELEKMQAAFGVGAGFVGQLITMIVQMVIGFITAIGLIFLMQKIVTRFIGGLVVQGAGLMKTLGLGGAKGKGADRDKSDTQSTATQIPPQETPGGEGTSGRPTTTTTTSTTTTRENGPKTQNPEPLPHETENPGQPTHIHPVTATADATDAGSGRLLN